MSEVTVLQNQIDAMIKMRKDNYIKELQQENKQLKERIDKAIEILKKWNEEYNGLLNKNVIYISEKDNDLFSLLKILKGDK